MYLKVPVGQIQARLNITENCHPRKHCHPHIIKKCSIGGGGAGNQAYSRLSTTHGHITDCKLDSVVYAGVCV